MGAQAVENDVDVKSMEGVESMEKGKIDEKMDARAHGTDSRQDNDAVVSDDSSAVKSDDEGETSGASSNTDTDGEDPSKSDIEDGSKDDVRLNPAAETSKDDNVDGEEKKEIESDVEMTEANSTTKVGCGNDHGKDSANVTQSEGSSSDSEDSAKHSEMEDAVTDGNGDAKVKDDSSERGGQKDDDDEDSADKDEENGEEEEEEAIASREEKSGKSDHNEGSEAEEEEELWDLKVILSAKDIAKARATPCSNEGCNLTACSIWASNLDPESPWYSCLDCQENDFGGWPEEENELPLKVMPEELRKVIVEKCTEQEDPIMPNLPTSAGEKGRKEEKAAEEAKQGKEKKFKDTEKGELQDEDGDENREKPEEESGNNEAADETNDEKSSKSETNEANDSNDDDDEEPEEAWDLKIVFSAKDLTKTKPVMCATEGCNLLACCAYVSTLDPENPWFSCIDCQETEFGGWPEEKSEYPIKFLSAENRKVMSEKCSEQEDPAMPDLPLALPLLATADKAAGDVGGAKGENFATITPPPGHDDAIAESQSNVVLGMARAGKGKSGKGGKKSSVTPSPMPPPDGAKEMKKESKAPTAPKPAAPPSKAALAMHQKWQAEAEKLGGPGVRIVVSKPAAKKLIFDMLHDSFSPMNITDIHKKMKGIVPPPILKSSLDDMVDVDRGNPFDGDSDDESDDGKSSKKKESKKTNSSTSDEFSGSLRVKEGRNANNILYFVNYTKLQNNGNGLLPDEKNELYSNIEKSKCELEALTLNLKQITSTTAQLLSEPTNENLAIELDEQEKNMEEINQQLEASRAHASNEKFAKQLKKRVDSMASTWRKRKRMCTEFLCMFDEMTDGTVSMKKCLNGDGQIEIESDEAAIKGAMAFAKKKKPRIAGRGGLQKGKANEGRSGLPPDEKMIGVKLDSQGKPQRVYLED